MAIHFDIGKKTAELRFDIRGKPAVAFASDDTRVILAGGDKSFTFQQTVAAERWEIRHGLAKFPSVTVVDSSGREVVGDVQYIDANQVVVMFSAPFSGTAYLN